MHAHDLYFLSNNARSSASVLYAVNDHYDFLLILVITNNM